MAQCGLHPDIRSHRGSHRVGLTVIELLMALIVSSVILAAVASLAFATGSASEITSNMNRNQAILRYTTLRIAELIKFSSSVVSATADGVELWADTNTDGVVDAAERFFIEKGADTTSLVYRTTTSSIVMVPICSDIQFQVDQVPPATRFVSVSFDMQDGTGTHKYQINGALRCRAVGSP